MIEALAQLLAEARADSGEADAALRFAAGR
jgi:hypothetical protein